MAASVTALRALAGEADKLSLQRARVRAAALRPESDLVSELRTLLEPLEPQLAAARRRAARWVETARAGNRTRPFAESLLEQFPLDSPQGRALMSLAEALLRTPDRIRADQLIAERLGALRSAGAVGSDDLLLGMGFALLTTASRLLPPVSAELAGHFSGASLTKPLVAPVARVALRSAMQMLGKAFIVGETIESAMARGHSDSELALCSFDVLGEGARTEADAQRYFEAYREAIDALAHQPGTTVHDRSSISVKLS